MTKRYADLTVGLATIPTYTDGGWVLPGGLVTKNCARALEVAQDLDQRIRAGTARAAAIALLKPAKPIVRRRRVHGPDAVRFTVSA